MATPVWINFLMSDSGLEGVGTGRAWTHKEIQERIYDGIGIDAATTKPFSKKRSEMTFNEECLRGMDEDEFYAYFTDDPIILEDEPKSSFKEANKKMKTIEESEKTTKVDVISQGLTFDNFLKKIEPKSSFKEANKKMKEIENENHR